MKHKPNEKWKKGTAANYMTNKVPIVKESFTIEDTQKLIQKEVNHLEKIDYIYVIDKNTRLIGVFSLKELYRLPPKTKIEKICKKLELVSAKPDDKKEYVIHLSLKHDISAIPIVDKNNKFLGVITKDKIIQILHKRNLEETFHISGIHKSHANFDNILEISIFKSIKHRILWLFLGLMGGILAASIIGSFEQTIKNNLILAAFIPLVVYIADAVGTQLEAFAIRDFAIFRSLNFYKYFLRQFSIVFIIAIILGIVTATLTLAIYNNLRISIVLGIAIISAIISSIFTGLLIPFLFRKLKSDPANGSGPIATIIQDILSVFVYFLIATLLL